MFHCANDVCYTKYQKCRKESFPSKDTDTKLLQSIFFVYEVDIISTCSNRICYR